MIWCPKRLASDTPAPAKGPMTVDEALANADTGADPCVPAQTLAAEVRRLRAAVEKLGDKDRTFHVAYGNDHWVKVSDVLAALEVE